MRKLIQKINGPQSCDKKVLSESLKEVFHKKKSIQIIWYTLHTVLTIKFMLKKSQFWENFTNWTIAHKTIHVFDRESFTNGPKSLKIGDLIPLV